jgi:hypothetical protein
MAPSRNLTVRTAPVAETAVAASKANAPDKVTNEASATRSLNSRRLSSLASLLFTALFLRLRARSEKRSTEFRSAWLTAKAEASACQVRIY